MGSVVEVKGLTKSYGDIRAVDSLDLDIAEGEIFGFLGPNGAGKTTTIKSIMGLLRPTAGTIRVMGEELDSNRRSATSKIGYLPENVDLYGNLTGRETLKFFADLRGASRQEVDELLGKVNLQYASDRKVGEYSKGMAQRLAFAQALVGKPPLLILDEPASGLDPEGTTQIKKMVKDYVDGSRTVFFSSHILPNVQEVADRVGIIVEGRLRALDSVYELRKRLDIPSKLTLTISRDYEEIRDELKDISPIKKFRGRGSRVEVICDQTDKKKVMDLLENEGIDILDFSSEEGDLEDIFMRFMKG